MASGTKLSALPTPDHSSAFEEKSVTIRGTTYRMRELSVKDSDDAAELATIGKDEVDGRLLLRFMILKGLQEPKLSIEDIGKLPNRIYRKLADMNNSLNFEDEGEEEDEAKND